ncbi:KN motif and ankyrin repeat domain-containing protein 3 [Denticeps clupeoides]|uniref:KN motif and ankyrin repeat domain-containing protein 3 n=1 Tax=Denticeps clupeoides TaxID=299321 RepID=A0AAY4D8S1_9TELE|nr:KN motif and ankyrin repeat domain-containing protein 3 [Denticeps clupeoides]
MTQSVQVNTKLPDLGAPFLYGSQEEVDQGGSYSVKTPYGFSLDLDFLKYVEEIESGHVRRAPVSGRRGGRGVKLSQRSPGVGVHASGWTSTESLSSSASEDGSRVPPPPPPRNRINSAPSVSHVLTPVTKVPPPPPARNPRVERTLLETSRRLQQEQCQVHNGSGTSLGFQLSDPPKGPLREAPRPAVVLVASQAPPESPQLLLSSSASPSQSGWTKPSPQNSGMSTPASAPGGAPLPPSQLQTVREQMAAALRQLKEMEERVKGVPALEREVVKLRSEKDRLLQALQKKNDTTQPTGTSSAETGSPGLPPLSLSHGRPTKAVEPSRLGGKDDQPEKAPVVTKDVAVGGEMPLSASVFYYSQGRRDASTSVQPEVCDKGVGVEATRMSDKGLQVKVETEEASVWVEESSLGLSSEVEREIEALHSTIRCQQEAMRELESRLSRADQDLEVLRAREQERLSKGTADKDVLVKPHMTHAEVETDTSLAPSVPPKTLCSVGVHCCPRVTDASVGQDLRTPSSSQGVQTDPEESPRKPVCLAQVSTASQWENLGGEEICQESSISTRRQATKTSPDEDTASAAESKAGDEVDGAQPCQSPVGTLKSIMKRKDGSSPGENRSAGKKSLQFVGILNGGYESTSSEDEDDEEEEEDGSSSDGSDAGACSESSEDEDAALEETSDEERNINLDESDSDGDPPGEDQEKGEVTEDSVKEKFELSMKMREACLILKNHLNDDAEALKSKEVLSSSHTVQLEWFRVSSAKAAQPSRVSNYLMAFSEVSATLLEHVVNMTDGNGNTALHYSVSHSNFVVVGLLLETGVCCVDQQNKAGYTAIMLAALSVVKEDEDMLVVRKLFGQGNVNAKASQAGQTALMLAVSHGRQEMVRALLECGASVNVQDDEGSTALMCASEHGRAEIVSLLLDQPGCDISIVDNDGSNALSIALEASHNDIAVLLYAHMNYSKSQAAGAAKATRSPTSPQKPWPAE